MASILDPRHGRIEFVDMANPNARKAPNVDIGDTTGWDRETYQRDPRIGLTGEDIVRIRWDIRFMRLAEHIASWSKDPSTKVGAVVIDADRRVIGCGYNGFARGVDDSPERYADRPTKYALVCHAELNAILNCAHRPDGATIYVWPLFSCAECAKAVIQSGIKRIVAQTPKEARWQSQYENALLMYREAGVTVEIIDLPLPESRNGWADKGDD